MVYLGRPTLERLKAWIGRALPKEPCSGRSARAAESGVSSRSEVFAASSRPAPPALRAECRATRCGSVAPSRWPLGAPRWSRCSGTVVGSLLKCPAFTPATKRPAEGRG